MDNKVYGAMCSCHEITREFIEKAVNRTHPGLKLVDFMCVREEHEDLITYRSTWTCVYRLHDGSNDNAAS